MIYKLFFNVIVFMKMKNLSLLLSTVFTLHCLLGSPSIASDRVLIDGDSDITLIHEVGRSRFIQEKVKRMVGENYPTNEGHTDSLIMQYKGEVARIIDLLRLDHDQVYNSSQEYSGNEKGKEEEEEIQAGAPLIGIGGAQKHDTEAVPLNLKTKAAYYQVCLNFATQEAEGLKNKIQLPTPQPTAFELKLAETNKTMKTRVEKIRKTAARLEQERPNLEERIDQLQKEILFYQQALHKLGVQPTDIDVLDILMLQALYYGDRADQAEAESKATNIDPQSSQAYQEALAQKLKFGDAFEKQHLALCQDIDFQIRIKGKRAEEKLEQYLAKNLVLEGAYYFREDYLEAQRVVNEYFDELRAKYPNKKYFNPVYLSIDPFLERGQADIHQAYRDNISDEEWTTTLPQQLYKSILFLLVKAKKRQFISKHIVELTHTDIINAPPSKALAKKKKKKGIRLHGKHIPFKVKKKVAKLSLGEFSKKDLIYAFRKLAGVFNRLKIHDNERLTDQKRLARKRFKRLIDTFIEMSRCESAEDDDPVLVEARGIAKAAIALTQNSGRCPDGVIAGLDLLENGLFRESHFAETEISQIFSAYAWSFCEKFAHYFARINDSEWRTNAPQFVKQRTFFALPHTGEPRTAFYALPSRVKKFANSLFSPSSLMRIFLRGQKSEYTNSFGRTTTFEAFTAEKAIDLVYEAYQSGRQKVKEKRTLSYDNIIDLINRDTCLTLLFHRFSDAIMDGNTHYSSEFFGMNKSGVVFKRPLFKYILQRLGYIIIPNNPWKDIHTFVKLAEENNLIREGTNDAAVLIVLESIRVAQNLKLIKNRYSVDEVKILVKSDLGNQRNIFTDKVLQGLIKEDMHFEDVAYILKIAKAVERLYEASVPVDEIDDIIVA